MIFTVEGSFNQRNGRVIFAQPGAGDTQVGQELRLGEVGRPGWISVTAGCLRQEAFGPGEGCVAAEPVPYCGEREGRAHGEQRRDAGCGDGAGDILGDQRQVDGL